MKDKQIAELLVTNIKTILDYLNDEKSIEDVIFFSGVHYGRTEHELDCVCEQLKVAKENYTKPLPPPPTEVEPRPKVVIKKVVKTKDGKKITKIVVKKKKKAPKKK